MGRSRTAQRIKNIHEVSQQRPDNPRKAAPTSLMSHNGNIWIPLDKMPAWRKALRYARNKDTTLSKLVIQLLEEFLDKEGY